MNMNGIAAHMMPDDDPNEPKKKPLAPGGGTGQSTTGTVSAGKSVNPADPHESTRRFIAAHLRKGGYIKPDNSGANTYADVFDPTKDPVESLTKHMEGLPVGARDFYQGLLDKVNRRMAVR